MRGIGKAVPSPLTRPASPGDLSRAKVGCFRLWPFLMPNTGKPVFGGRGLGPVPLAPHPPCFAYGSHGPPSPRSRGGGMECAAFALHPTSALRTQEASGRVGPHCPPPTMLRPRLAWSPLPALARGRDWSARHSFCTRPPLRAKRRAGGCVSLSPTHHASPAAPHGPPSPRSRGGGMECAAFALHPTSPAPHPPRLSPLRSPRRGALSPTGRGGVSRAIDLPRKAA